jgi:hypothetical protein
MIDTEAREAFKRGYRECLLWQATDEDGGPLDDYGPDEVADWGDTEDDCDAFLDSQTSDLMAYVAHPEGSRQGEFNAWECAGHDFCLTRNHHGAGFWDRGMGDLGDRLTYASHPFGSVDVYVGDDDRLYVS